VFLFLFFCFSCPVLDSFINVYLDIIIGYNGIHAILIRSSGKRAVTCVALSLSSTHQIVVNLRVFAESVESAQSRVSSCFSRRLHFDVFYTR